MKQRMENYLKISCHDVDLQKVSHLEFYLRQGDFFRQYSPVVINEHEMTVKIPYADAMQLDASHVRLQFAFVDENGASRASEVQSLSAGVLLKEAGYDPF